jgi:hypothetical protein
MSDEIVKHGENGAHGGYEHEDMSARSVFIFLIGLGLICVLVYFFLRGMYGYLEAYDRAHQPVQNPLKPPAAVDTRETRTIEVDREVKTNFPEPRLEGDERTEIRDFRLQEEKTLNSYGWVNQQAGVVHIPIERAMQLVAERGLPVRAQVEVSRVTGKKP